LKAASQKGYQHLLKTNKKDFLKLNFFDDGYCLLIVAITF